MKQEAQKRRYRRKVALWKKIVLSLELMILAVIIAAAVYLIRSGFFEESAVVFGELMADQIYFAAGQGETAVFTIQATNSELAMYLCDSDGETVGEMHDDGKNGDETAGDGIYTCALTIADEDGGARTYHVEEAKTASGEATIYLFKIMTEEEFVSACALCDATRSALDEIEAGYADASGYVTVDDFPDIFAEVSEYLETLVRDGTVLLYTVEEDSAYIKFASGISMCYEPTLEGTFSGESDPTLAVTYYQPAEGSYAAECTDELEGAMTNIENVQIGETLQGAEVTIETVKSLTSGQVIVWYGHGAYSAETGPCVMLSVTAEDFSVNMSEDDQKDLFKDLLTTAYQEDGEQYLAFTAAYVTQYCGDLSDDLIFLSACYGGKDTRLADAFLSCGATAVLCFSDQVFCGYAAGMIDGVLQYMLRAWPGSEWFYTLEQALERMETSLGKSDAVWLEKYADMAEFQSSVVACGAEPVLLTQEDVDGSESDASESASITETADGSEGAASGSAGNTETADDSEGDASESSGGSGTVGGDEDSTTEDIIETETTDNGEAEGDNATSNSTGDSDGERGAIRLSTEQGSLSGATYYYSVSPTAAAGATVTIYQDGELYMELATDEHGKYSVAAMPVGIYDITFSMEGYSDYYLENVNIYCDETTTYADGYFFTNGTITGTVLDALTGEPLAEAEVELLIGDNETIYRLTVLTDDSGAFTFDLTEESKSAALSEIVTYFPEGSDYEELLRSSAVMEPKQLTPDGLSGYTLGIAGSGVIVYEKDGYAGETIEITVTGFESIDVGTLELTPQVEIGGYVYDSNKNALGGVEITVTVIDDGSSKNQTGTDNSDTGDEEAGESETGDGDEETDGSGTGDTNEETGGSETGNSGAGTGESETENTADAGDAANITYSTASTGDVVSTETGVDGSYSLSFDIDTEIKIRITYKLSGYETKTVDYVIDASMIADGKVELADVYLSREKQVVTDTVYATSVVSFVQGDPWTSQKDAMNPADALGEPDYTSNKNAITLGAGGVLVLGFDVDFCNGDGIDIYIYEVGDDVETTLVEVSRDGETWVNVGTVDGSTSGIDLDGLVSSSSTFRYIRLTDLGSHSGGWWPGADIDAVAVTHYMQ